MFGGNGHFLDIRGNDQLEIHQFLDGQRRDGAVGGGPGAMVSGVPEAGFLARLDAEAERLGSLLCVGLDPHPGSFDGSAADFCRRIIDATAGAALAFKPNSAFFEAAGTDGLAQLATVVGHVAGDRLVILDAKRGDIGSTAEAYARAAFEVIGESSSAYVGFATAMGDVALILTRVH